MRTFLTLAALVLGASSLYAQSLPEEAIDNHMIVQGVLAKIDSGQEVPSKFLRFAESHVDDYARLEAENAFRAQLERDAQAPHYKTRIADAVRGIKRFAKEKLQTVKKL